MPLLITYRKYTIKCFLFPNFRPIIFLGELKTNQNNYTRGIYKPVRNMITTLNQLQGKPALSPILNQDRLNNPAWRIIYTFAIT